MTQTEAVLTLAIFVVYVATATISYVKTKDVLLSIILIPILVMALFVVAAFGLTAVAKAVLVLYGGVQ